VSKAPKVLFVIGQLKWAICEGKKTQKKIELK
jgi:hypothetical protein